MAAFIFLTTCITDETPATMVHQTGNPTISWKNSYASSSPGQWAGKLASLVPRFYNDQMHMRGDPLDAEDMSIQKIDRIQALNQTRTSIQDVDSRLPSFPYLLLNITTENQFSTETETELAHSKNMAGLSVQRRGSWTVVLGRSSRWLKRVCRCFLSDILGMPRTASRGKMSARFRPCSNPLSTDRHTFRHVKYHSEGKTRAVWRLR